MKTFTKIFTLCLLVLVVTTTFSPAVFAQREYEPLESLPGTTGSDNRATAQEYIPGLFRLAIALAGVLSVLMIVVGGVQYLSTDAISGKEEGKERITNAILGLLLAIGAYAILYTINPKTLQFNLDTIQKVNTPSSTEPELPPAQTPWGDDSSVRAQLAAMGISINKSNCTYLGASNCTSVYQLSGSALNGLQWLSNRCRLPAASSCNGQIVLTGGTEYWLHGNRTVILSQAGTNHVPGGGAVDLSKSSSALNTLIESFPKVTAPNGCAPGQGYNVNGTVYVDEIGGDAHWHVCY